MMTELIRRVKFRCIPIETAGVRLARTTVGAKATRRVVQRRAYTISRHGGEQRRYCTVIVALVASFTSESLRKKRTL